MGILERIGSYVTWPDVAGTTTPSPLRLANAGFMYTGERNTVRCPICRLEIAGWTRAGGEGDTDEQRPLLSPKTEHRTRSPECRLALECSKSDGEDIEAIRTSAAARRGGLPGTSDPGRNASQPAATGKGAENVDVVAVAAAASSKNSQKPESGLQKILAESLSRMMASRQSPAVAVPPAAPTSPPPQSTVVDRNNPNFDQLRAESTRLLTYHDWPVSAHVRPAELAAEGFFYTGQTDRVRCAYCRGVLHRWARGDRAADEHRRHYPTCPFVMGRNVGNVPIHAQSSASTSTSGAVAMSTISSSGVRSNRNDEVAGQKSDVTQSTSGSKNKNNASGHTSKETAAANIPPEDDEEQLLLIENQRMTETMTCKVCIDREVDTVFLPCGHLVACADCSTRLRDCPICRTYIRGTVKTFLS